MSSLFCHISNLVYRINYKDCNASYVKQTDRILKTRIKKHRNHINWNTTQQSVITAHRLDFSYEFD